MCQAPFSAPETNLEWRAGVIVLVSCRFSKEQISEGSRAQLGDTLKMKLYCEECVTGDRHTRRLLPGMPPPSRAIGTNQSLAALTSEKVPHLIYLGAFELGMSPARQPSSQLPSHQMPGMIVQPQGSPQLGLI